MDWLRGNFVDDLSFDEDDEWDEEEDFAILMLLEMETNKRLKHGGSVVGHAVIRRKRQEVHQSLMRDYFAPNPVYPERYFRRRYRMSIDLWMLIAAALQEHDTFFVQKRNCVGTLGHSNF